MIYFKVKKHADNIRIPNMSNGWHFVANEIITVNEASKMKLKPKFLKANFSKVETSKFNTHWFFGCRFLNQLNQKPNSIIYLNS